MLRGGIGVDSAGLMSGSPVRHRTLPAGVPNGGLWPPWATTSPLLLGQKGHSLADHGPRYGHSVDRASKVVHIWGSKPASFHLAL
jgi:hypothetical protein